MSHPSKLNAILAESAEEVRGYLRDHLRDIAIVTEKALQALDEGRLPIAEAGRLFDEAKAVDRLTGNLTTYADIAERMEDTE